MGKLDVKPTSLKKVLMIVPPTIFEDYRGLYIETYNEKTGFLAMEMWTGFHASMVMQHIANLKVKPGAHPIEKALSGIDFYNYSKEPY